MKSLRPYIIAVLLIALAIFSANAQGRRGGGQGGPPAGAQAGEGGPERPSDPMSTPTFGGLRFRSIGPSVVGGRVIAFAVDPNDRAKFFIAVASGGVWKTVNAGTTWTPVFDNYGSFSIGAVALDTSGKLAAATSTGGLQGKLPGRVGDTPIIGAGCWADQRAAVSCTGLGEYFMRVNAAADVSARIAYAGANVEQAANAVIEDVRQLGGYGGLIAVDRNGNVATPFASEGMKRGIATSSGRREVATFG